MTTLHELLEDNIYARWLARTPLPTPAPKGMLPRPPVWTVWVKQEGKRWRRFNFSDYQKAYAWLMKNLPKLEDAALANLRSQQGPPIVKVGERPGTITREGKKVKVMVPIRKHWTALRASSMLHEDEEWCGHCRRPTRFGFYRRHHALSPRTFALHERRCSLCGARLSTQRFH